MPGNPQSEVVESTFRVNGLELAARLWNWNQGLPTIALHGWLDNAASFDLLAPQLPTLSICAIDLPGHGRSAHRPQGVAYHFVDYVADVLALANELGWERFILLGHSLGASIATLTAAVEPDRVVHTLLIESVAPVTSAADQAVEQLRLSIRQRLESRRRRNRAYTSVEAAAGDRAEGVLPLSLEAARMLCERGMRPAGSGFTWSSDPGLKFASPLRLTPEVARAFVQSVTVPSLLILGRQSGLSEREDFRAMMDTHRNLEIVMLNGGHHLHLEKQASDVAAAIGSFITAHNASDAF